MRYFIKLKNILLSYECSGFLATGRIFDIDEIFEKYILETIYIIDGEYHDFFHIDDESLHEYNIYEINSGYHITYNNNKLLNENTYNHIKDNAYIEVKDNISFCKVKMLCGM